MGLLDDAIREHLELKRRRGADPGEVAREQREVLDVREDADAQAPELDAAALAPDVEQDVPPASADAEAPVSDAQPAPARGEPPALEETAELDMSSVLGDDVDAGSPAPGGDEDSLEWEVPGDAPEEEVGEPAEDVLEETPEFLRETPEEDRLWFEQRPPRDFDFDK